MTMMHRGVLAVLTLVCVPGTALAQLNPVLIRPIVKGQRIVAATVHVAGTWRVVYSQNADGGAASQTVDVVVGASDTGLARFDFGGRVPSGLEEGWVVTLFAVPGGGAAPVQHDQATVSRAEARVYLQPPTEGDQVVKGRVEGTADRVRVEVFNSSGNPVDSDLATVTNGAFTAGMNGRLSVGQTVRVTALQGDAEVGATTDFSLVRTAGFDWGRARAYFSAGVTFAQQDADTVDGDVTTRDRTFGSADYFVSLALDVNWFTTLRDRFATPCRRPARAVEELRQLEDLVDRWDGGDFRRRIPSRDLEQNPAAVYERIHTAVGQFENVLKAAIDTMEGSNRDCLAIDSARVELLRASMGRLTRSRGALRAANGATADAVNPTVAAEQSRAAVNTAEKAITELRTAIGKDASSQQEAETRAQAATAAAKAALDLHLQEVQAAIDQLDRDLEEFRKEDPTNARRGQLVNTAFEARLGQAPVAGAETATAPARIVQTANSGYVGMDIYAPRWPRRTSWFFKENEYAFFAAPLARFALLAASNGPVPVIDGVERPELYRRLYGIRAIGIRLGHLKMDRSGAVAPELVSYFDVTYGKFENFRHLAGDGPAKGDHVPSRTELHGRLKLPEMPLYIGLTANIGPGRDDMRFFFGTRFDFSKAIAGMVPANP